MISREPIIRVGITDRRQHVSGEFNGPHQVSNRHVDGAFSVEVEGDAVLLKGKDGEAVGRGRQIVCSGNSTFTLHEVTIGIDFHWERKQSQTFQGDLVFQLRDDGTIAVINSISLEQYLESVLSSEMSAEAPLEFLKAHAITSRSWLAAMLEREQSNPGVSSPRTVQREGELVRWYDREDHDLYDVCADDHCQRYQGISSRVWPAVAEAVESTKGVFLVHNGTVCDARFSKSCGGLTEAFENCWENTPIPYLQCVADSSFRHPTIASEDAARRWILSRPDAYCNLVDSTSLRQILPSFDRETTDFFRWKVVYRREELEELVRSKSGIDFGTLKNLVPIQRGPSGRIVKLRIEGTKASLTVGKELEIRRWLSKSHLKSSAFVIDTERDSSGISTRFILHGAGWGHGVGLCQIGAASMAMQGKNAEEILKHYFHRAELEKLHT